jgi:hypothetical protein
VLRLAQEPACSYVLNTIDNAALLVRELPFRPAKDNAGDDRVRPWQGVYVPGVSVGVPLAGHQPAARPSVHPDLQAHIERTIESVGSLFAQFVAGFAGSSAERRGRNQRGCGGDQRHHELNAHASLPDQNTYCKSNWMMSRLPRKSRKRKARSPNRHRSDDS